MTNAVTKAAALPEQLQTQGKGIVRVLAQADKAAYDYEVKTQTAATMIREAKATCEDLKVSFAKFTKEIGIGKSRAYELLAIAEGKKTVDEVRAATAARQKRLQEKRKAAVEAQEEDEGDDDKAQAKAAIRKARESQGFSETFDVKGFLEFVSAAYDNHNKAKFLEVIQDEVVAICDEFNVPR